MPDEKKQPLEPLIFANQEIDVAEIMTAVQKRIQEKKNSGILDQNDIDEISEMELFPLPDILEVPNFYEPHLYPGTRPGDPDKKEFHPTTVTFENEDGPGLRGLVKKTLSLFRKVFFPLVRFMTRPIYNELKQFTVDLHNQNGNRMYEIDLNNRIARQSKEYIILLHNALNNMIVVSSKMKIDQEMLKTKIKVLEDKIEFLENRERALEKKLFTVSNPSIKNDGDISGVTHSYK